MSHLEYDPSLSSEKINSHCGSAHATPQFIKDSFCYSWMPFLWTNPVLLAEILAYSFLRLLAWGWQGHHANVTRICPLHCSSSLMGSRSANICQLEISNDDCKGWRCEQTLVWYCTFPEVTSSNHPSHSSSKSFSSIDTHLAQIFSKPK